MAFVERRKTGDKIFDFANYTLLIVMSITFIYPVLVVLMSSFTAESVLMKEGFKLIPKEFSLEAYKYIFSGSNDILKAATTSVLATVIGTFLNVVITCMYAYGMSVDKLPFKKFFMIIILITMFFGGGLIPTYMVYTELKLINNFWVLVLPAILSPFNMLLIRNYFMSISASLKESARLDGATEIQVLFRIMLPLSTPILATIALFSAVGYWNDWTSPMFFSTGNKLINLQFMLQKMMTRLSDVVKQNPNLSAKDFITPAQGIKMAVVVIATTPIICVYPFLQKYFVTGIMIGGVKE